jgi:hypothetical protein
MEISNGESQLYAVLIADGEKLSETPLSESTDDGERLSRYFVTTTAKNFQIKIGTYSELIYSPGSVLYGNPWVPICWAFCIIAILQIIIGAIYVITIPIRRWLAKFIQRQKEDIAYFEEFNNIKPRNEEALFEEDEEAPGLFDDIHDYDEVKEKRKRS